MKRLNAEFLTCVSVFCSCFPPNGISQTNDDSRAPTMRPIIRGRSDAVSSMKAEATEAARRILGAGGNAFDAAGAGQAALAVTDLPSNGVIFGRHRPGERFVI